MTPTSPTEKRCSSCAEVKHIDGFRRSSATKDGLQNYCRSCHNEANARWRERNREKHLRSLRSWHENNRDHSREMNRVWQRNNRQRKRVIDQKRRASTAANGKFIITPREVKRLYSQPCSACGSNENITLDHIVPLSRGGRHSVGNLQPLCKSCNSSKKDRLMIEWRSRLQFC